MSEIVDKFLELNRTLERAENAKVCAEQEIKRTKESIEKMHSEVILALANGPVVLEGGLSGSDQVVFVVSLDVNKQISVVRTTLFSK